MATQKKVLPFKNYLSFYSQDSHFFEVDGYKYACLTLNVGSKSDEYNFLENEIKFVASHASGYVEGDSVWFLAKVPKDSKGKIFDLLVKTKDFKIDKEKTDKEAELWESGKQLIAIDCSNIPPLKIMAQALAEHKAIASGTLRLLLNASLDGVKEALDQFLDFSIAEGKFPKSSDAEIFSKIEILSNSCGILMPFSEKYPIPKTNEINQFGFPTGEMIIDSIPFEGEFPNIERLIFKAPPKPEQKSNGGKSWGGSTSVNVEGYQADKAWSFCKDNFNEIQQFFGLDKYAAIRVTLALAGVNALPNIFPPSNDDYQLIPNINADSAINTNSGSQSNGHIKTEDPVVEDSAVEEPSESIEQHIIRRFTTLKLDHQKWLKRHQDEDERELILRIIESQCYLHHSEDINKWCGEQLGTDLPVPVTALPKKEMLQDLLNLVKDTEAKMEIDPKARFVGV